MMDFMNIGCVPVDEECAQLGQKDYHERAKRECIVLINQLRRIHGDPPEGAHLRIKSFPHDFGVYVEVVCYYEEGNKGAYEYALNCEDLPETWDDEAKKELDGKQEQVVDNGKLLRVKDVSSVEELMMDEPRYVACPACGYERMVEVDADYEFECEGCKRKVKCVAII